MKKDLASARPWVLTSYPDGLGGKDKVIESIDGKKIADCFTAIRETEEEKQNAALIVRSVNNFDDLMDSVLSAYAVLSTLKLILNPEAWEIVKPIKEKLETAISNAEK